MAIWLGLEDNIWRNIFILLSQFVELFQSHHTCLEDNIYTLKIKFITNTLKKINVYGECVDCVSPTDAVFDAFVSGL